MPLQEIYHITEMMLRVAVIISIVFVTIELRQNTYITRKSKGDQREQREQRTNRCHETISTNAKFRSFAHKMVTGFDDRNQDERMRATGLGTRQPWSVINELEACSVGQISDNKRQNLSWNIEYYKTLRRYIILSSYKMDAVRSVCNERTQKTKQMT